MKPVAEWTITFRNPYRPEGSSSVSERNQGMIGAAPWGSPEQGDNSTLGREEEICTIGAARFGNRYVVA